MPDSNAMGSAHNTPPEMPPVVHKKTAVAKTHKQHMLSNRITNRHPYQHGYKYCHGSPKTLQKARSRSAQHGKKRNPSIPNPEMNLVHARSMHEQLSQTDAEAESHASQISRSLRCRIHNPLEPNLRRAAEAEFKYSNT